MLSQGIWGFLLFNNRGKNELTLFCWFHKLRERTGWGFPLLEKFYFSALNYTQSTHIYCRIALSVCSTYLKYRGTPDENQQCEISAPREKGGIRSDPLGWLLARLQRVCALPSTPSALDFSGCFERQKESW